MSVGNESNNSKPDSTSCDNDEIKREKMDIDMEKVCEQSYFVYSFWCNSHS